MSKRWNLFIYLLVLIGTLVYGEDYATSEIYSVEEISYIEELQKEEIKVGVYWGSRFLDEKEPEKSLVCVYKQLLEDFFHFNIRVKRDSWNNLYDKLKNEEIDILIGMAATMEREADFNFSLPLYENKAYIVAGCTSYPLSSWNDLEGREVAVLASSYYSNYLKRFKKEKYIDFEIREVDAAPDAKEYDYAFLPSDKIHEKYKLKKLEMGEVVPIRLGLANSRFLLRDILDRALEYGHRDEILNLLEGDRLRRVKRDFYELLTPEERNYLEKKERIEVFFETDFYPMVYYDRDKKDYDGIFVRGLNQISLLLNKPVHILNETEESETSIYNRFKRGEGDLLPTFLTPERAELHLFSRPMDHREILLVANKGEVDEKEMKVGVVENNVTEKTARKYLSKDKELILYKNFRDMIEALKNGEIESCIMDSGMFTYFHQTRLDLKLQKLRLLGSVPISMIYQNGDEVLKSIVLKAGENFIDYQEIKSRLSKEMRLVKTARVLEDR